MKATYDPKAKTKFTTAHRRENGGFLEEISVIDYSEAMPSGRARAPIVARIYVNSTKSTNTACLWINGQSISTSGSGKAAGWGYDRPSAALDMAIRNAGITLSESIEGAGNSSMEAALLAIAELIGVSRPAIHRAHP